MVDKCLLLFMGVLLIQSGCSLFFTGGGNGTGSEIDIIVRTSSAAIFGYILSANFNRRTASGVSTVQHIGEVTQQIQVSSDGEGPQARIGFQLPDAEAGETNLEKAVPATVSAENTQPQERGVQVVAATVIGLFSLSILLLLRWFGMPEDSAATAMAAQFRDFVSGCVGFLIGCPTDKGNQTSS